MNVREAVKDKAQYKDIVAYFQELDTLSTDQMVLLIDTIEVMSEEIFEHYKALQRIFKAAVSEILKRRDQEGGFSFLTDSQKGQLSYALRKGAPFMASGIALDMSSRSIFCARFMAFCIFSVAFSAPSLR